jgi:putative phosphoesterase
VISDTHGLLRPEAVAALRGSDLIIHAGDIGSPEVLPELRRLAPVLAVRGNVDREPWADALPLTEVVEAGGVSIYLLHDLRALDLDPKAAGFVAVVSGHTHRPVQERRGEVLFFNAGSAGPRRFRLPISVGRLIVRGKEVRSELVTLNA